MSPSFAILLLAFIYCDAIEKGDIPLFRVRRGYGRSAFNEGIGGGYGRGGFGGRGTQWGQMNTGSWSNGGFQQNREQQGGMPPQFPQNPLPPNMGSGFGDSVQGDPDKLPSGANDSPYSTVGQSAPRPPGI